MDAPNLPPVEVIIGWVVVFVTGLALGAAICLPIVHKHSDIPLERLSGEWIWRYTPDWLLSVVGCIITLVLCFLLISGMWRV